MFLFNNHIYLSEASWEIVIMLAVFIEGHLLSLFKNLSTKAQNNTHFLFGSLEAADQHKTKVGIGSQDSMFKNSQLSKY